MRYGFTELSSATGYSSASARATVSASSNEPSTVTISAPWATACASLPIATRPAGTTT